MRRTITTISTCALLVLGAVPAVGQPPARPASEVPLLWTHQGVRGVSIGTAADGPGDPLRGARPVNSARATVSADGALLLQEGQVVAADDTGSRRTHAGALAFAAPDGRRVIVAEGGELRVLDTFDVRTGFGDDRPPPTVHARIPLESGDSRGAWPSPDLRDVVFLDGTTLRAASLQGGPTTAVADLSAYGRFPQVTLEWAADGDLYALAVPTFDDGRWSSLAQVRSRDHAVVRDLNVDGRVVNALDYNGAGSLLWLQWLEPDSPAVFGGTLLDAGVADRDGSGLRDMGQETPFGRSSGPTGAIWVDDTTLLVRDPFDDVLRTWDVGATSAGDAVGPLPANVLPVQPVPSPPPPARLPPLDPPPVLDAGRLDSDSPIDAAVGMSATRFPSGGAAHAVLSRHDVFADSLAGAPLTADGPMLFTTPGDLVPSTAAELSRVLEPGATVYLLGGTAALSADVEASVADLGFTPRRLAGGGRIDTAVEVAREVIRLTGSDRLYVARAFGPDGNPTAAWADSVAGGAAATATGTPVVVVGATLPEAVADLVSEAGITATTVLGGQAAVPAAVVDRLPSPTRLAGDSRVTTAVAIAEAVFDLGARTDGTMLLVNGEQRDGWALGFLAAGLAADRDLPLLLSGQRELPAAVQQALRSCTEGRGLLIGSQTVLSARVADGVLDACR